MKKIDLGNDNFIEVQVDYTLGGMNYFTGSEEIRGYYINVSPIKITERGNGYCIREQLAFSGVKQLVKEVKRKSKKAENEAMILAKSYENELVEYVARKGGIELPANWKEQLAS